ARGGRPHPATRQAAGVPAYTPSDDAAQVGIPRREDRGRRATARCLAPRTGRGARDSGVHRRRSCAHSARVSQRRDGGTALLHRSGIQRRAGKPYLPRYAVGRPARTSQVRLSRSRPDPGERSRARKASLTPTQPLFPVTDAYIQASDKATTMAVVDHAMTLNKRVFVYSPMSSFLLISTSMNTSTNGSTTPFSTCDHRTMFTRRSDGISRTKIPPAAIRKV